MSHICFMFNDEKQHYDCIWFDFRLIQTKNHLLLWCFEKKKRKRTKELFGVNRLILFHFNLHMHARRCPLSIVISISFPFLSLSHAFVSREKAKNEQKTEGHEALANSYTAVSAPFVFSTKIFEKLLSFMSRQLIIVLFLLEYIVAIRASPTLLSTHAK